VGSDSSHCRLTNLKFSDCPGGKTLGIGRRKSTITIGMYIKRTFSQYEYVNSIFINKVLMFNAKE